jgi:heme-degrading monooxygenase HmoA
MSFRSIIRFQVKPGMADAFEAAFAACRMLDRPSAIDGFIMAELVRSVTEPLEYHVLGEWETEQAYADWQAISHEGADPAAVEALNATLLHWAPGRLYQPVSRSA